MYIFALFNVQELNLIETTENWYCQVHKSVTELEDVTVIWNQGVQEDREVLANRRDIIAEARNSQPAY
jgi:hypothetical protein